MSFSMPQFWTLSLLLTGCGHEVTVNSQDNEPPTAVIASHINDEVLVAGSTLLIHGTAYDPDDTPETLIATWSADGVTVCEAAPGADGSTQCLIDVAADLQRVSLTVRDAHNASASDVVTLDVLPPDTPPACRITSPAQGASSTAEVELTAEAFDPDVDAQELSVSWVSDLDGHLATTTGDASGMVTFHAAGLSTGQHQIQMMVVDPDGVQCEDAVSVQVDGPPTAWFIAPLGATVAQGQLVEVLLEVGDAEDDVSTLFVALWSDLAGGLGSTSVDVDGLATWQVALAAGQHALLAEVTDSLGNVVEVTDTVVVNAPPSPPVVSLPAEVSTLDDLVVNVLVDSVDPEGASVDYEYVWDRDGTSVNASDLVPAAVTTRGETWTVTVTPNDGLLDGPPSLASVTVMNTAPSLIDVALSPDPPRTDDLLVAAPVGWTDADGDSPAYEYAWTVNGNSAGDTSDTLDGDWFAVADQVTVSVTPMDDQDAGLPILTSVTVSNTPPTADGVDVTPLLPVTTDDLVAVVAAVSDVDDQALDTSFRWLDSTGNVLGTDLVLPASLTARGDEIYVEVEVTDGTDSTLVQSAAVTIGNAPPSLQSASLRPLDPVVGDTVEVSWSGFADDDPSDPQDVLIQWSVDGTAVSGATNASFVLSNTFPGASVSVSATPFDGTDTGVSVFAETMVANQPPTAPVVAVSPSEPTGGDPLLCEVIVEGTDPDGTALVYHYTWFRDGVEVTAPDDQNVADSAWTEPEQTWRCEAKSFDGAAHSDAAADAVAVAVPLVMAVEAAGNGRTCGLDDNGTVFCWGTDDTSPVHDLPFTTFRVALTHACALDELGFLVCWGEDEVPDVSALDGVYTDLAVGSGYICVLDSGGKPACAGDASPVGMEPDLVLQTLSGGDDFVCGVDENQELACWGNDSHGQVTDLPPYQADRLECGATHCCAVDLGGNVRCWGNEASDATDDQTDTFLSVSTDDQTSCGMLADTSLKCWGYLSLTWNLPTTGTGFQQVTTGASGGCALRDGVLSCWGYPTFTGRNPPTEWW
jgi:hypothetical protein